MSVLSDINHSYAKRIKDDWECNPKSHYLLLSRDMYDEFIKEINKTMWLHIAHGMTCFVESYFGMEIFIVENKGSGYIKCI